MMVNIVTLSVEYNQEGKRLETRVIKQTNQNSIILIPQSCLPKKQEKAIIKLWGLV